MISVRDAVVVVIDDNDANTALFVVVLRRMGITKIHTVSDPRDALATVRTVDPDLILLDLHMPHVDGFEVLASLRRITEHDVYLPVLVLTADSTADAKHRALTAGAHDFLSKPIDHRELVLRITCLLETRSLYRSLQSHNAALAAKIRTHATESGIDSAELARRRRQFDGPLRGDGLHMVVQPIRELATGNIVGAEALARFTASPHRTPDVWFADAHRIGLGVSLELAAVRHAIDLLPQIPDTVYLSINASPATVCSIAFADLIAEVPASRIVVELTEHARIDDYESIIPALDQLRLQGVRLAVDDAGAGFASLHHVLKLLPDIIKIDRVFTGALDRDPVRRAMVTAFVGLATEIGADVVAEGVETQAEADALRDLGVFHGQGYHLGRPGRVDLVHHRSGLA